MILGLSGPGISWTYNENTHNSNKLSLEPVPYNDPPNSCPQHVKEPHVPFAPTSNTTSRMMESDVSNKDLDYTGSHMREEAMQGLLSGRSGGKFMTRNGYHPPRPRPSTALPIPLIRAYRADSTHRATSSIVIDTPGTSNQPTRAWRTRPFHGLSCFQDDFIDGRGHRHCRHPSVRMQLR